MDKRYVDAAEEVNEKLRFIPRIPLSGMERDRRLKELIEWRGMERYVSPETMQVIRELNSL